MCPAWWDEMYRRMLSSSGCYLIDGAVHRLLAGSSVPVPALSGGSVCPPSLVTLLRLIRWALPPLCFLLLLWLLCGLAWWWLPVPDVHITSMPPVFTVVSLLLHFVLGLFGLTVMSSLAPMHTTHPLTIILLIIISMWTAGVALSMRGTCLPACRLKAALRRAPASLTYTCNGLDPTSACLPVGAPLVCCPRPLRPSHSLLEHSASYPHRPPSLPPSRPVRCSAPRLPPTQQQ